MASRIKISDNMTYSPEVVYRHTPLRSALGLMRKYHIRHLPVMSHNRVVGIISHRDIKTKSKDLDASVSTLMVEKPYKVKRNQYLYDVTKKMAEKKLGCAIVENEDGEIVGIFTTTDALFLLSRLLKDSDYARLKFDQINWSEFPEYMI